MLVTISEIKSVFSELQNNRSPGDDGIIKEIKVEESFLLSSA